MANIKEHAHGTQTPPQPIAISDRGHPMPRRTTPEASVTLRHHRLARDAYVKPILGNAAGPNSANSPRRYSSGESHETGQSDPKKWFDHSNRAPAAPFDHSSMDIDPPFFQRMSDSSNDYHGGPVAESAYPNISLKSQAFRPTITHHSSSADDYRSVIDDLTIENKRLKEELRRYKQFGPDLLRREKLFEIKVHGLPPRQWRELELALRDIAASAGGSTEASSAPKKFSKHANRLHASSVSDSKHASPSSSNSRPADSAYASMSTGPSSISQNPSTVSLGRPPPGRTKSSDQKVESYLKDIPEGLYPRQVPMTEKEKKKWVVKRLEQLFTGKITGRGLLRNSSSTLALEPQVSTTMVSVPASIEPSREARILLHGSGHKAKSRDNLSTSNLNRENESGGNGAGSGRGSGNGSGNNTSPETAEAPEQRPTRPLDLDPDRLQVPSDNMEYIRHLGVMAPQYLSQSKYQPADVSMDADGWIHLNLLCNLAQLHMYNVTPDFVRSAVSEKSVKFQLSRDGRKIRWRGGTENTKFSGDSSGDNSQRSPGDTEDTDGSNVDGQRKRKRANETKSAFSSNDQSKFGPQMSGSSRSFHYKPLFTHHSTSGGDTSMDESGSQASFGAIENSNLGENSRSTFISGSGTSPRKRRRVDGAIIYYSGAHFCTDLSGDPGDISPTTYLTSTGQEQEPKNDGFDRPRPFRSGSGSSLPVRPLSDGLSTLPGMDLDLDDAPELVTDNTDLSDDDEFEFPWCDEPDKVQAKPMEAYLEASGLGGVSPEDHFAMLVVTRHPKDVQNKLDDGKRPDIKRLKSDETTNSVISRVAALSTSSPCPSGPVHEPASRIRYEVLGHKLKVLKPVVLPPPATFFPPFSESSESGEDASLDFEEEDDDFEDMLDSSEPNSRRVIPNQSDTDLPRDFVLSSDDDAAAGIAKEKPTRRVSFGSGVRKTSRSSGRRPSLRGKSAELNPDSSGATAGEESGYSSSEEEDY